MAINVAAYCKTDQGLKRSRNEDVCAANIEQNFFMVADGMGGVSGGDIASSLFLETVSDFFTNQNGLSLEENKEHIKACFTAANSKILSHVETNPSHAGMGCTAELLTFWQDMFLLGHVGDSRTYWFDDGDLNLLTRDHSLVQEQVDKGVMTTKQAKKSRFKNVLSRAVGVKSMIDAELIFGKVIQGNIFLLCTDGLHNMLSEEQVTAVLSYDAPLDLKCEMLVNMSNEAGGQDNISVTLVEVLE